MSIEARSITKTFGAFTALQGVNLHIPGGELVALLGPSGSGKTTLLRIIAGLEVADQGQVLFDGEDATERSVRARRVGFVFQHYALFRHLTVFENVAFGLRVRPRPTRPPAAEIRAQVHTLLELVQLDSLAQRYPSQLSGGQRQRVALARALAVEPKVLLLDEPFGSLDAQIRQELRRWLRRLHDQLHVTSVFVTHDQEEALEVADRVVIMNRGVIEQFGTPEEVYHHPANPFVYRFLGNVNLFHSRVGEGSVWLGEMGISVPEQLTDLDRSSVIYVRPHDVEVARQRNGDGMIAVVVRRVRAIGPVVRLELAAAAGGQTIEAELSAERYRELMLLVGERAFVRFRNPRVFAEDYSI